MRAPRLLLPVVLVTLAACATHSPAHQHAAQERCHAAPALRQSRDLFAEDHHELAPGPGLLRSGTPPRVRLQPRRSAARLPRGGAARSGLRHVLLGHRADLRLELQQPDRRRARARGVGGRPEGAGAGREGDAAGARDHRGAGGAPLRRPQGRPRRPRSRVRRRHAPGGAAVSRRSRRRDVLRRRHDEPAPVAPVDAGREARARDGRDRRHASARAGRHSRPSGRPPSLHPRGGGQPRAGARRGRCRPPGSADAGRGPPGPHALAHLLPGGALRGCRDGERPRRAGRPRVLRREPAERDLPHGVLPPQPRLHLALGQHGGAQRGDAARRARAGGGNAPRDGAPDVGHGDRPGRRRSSPWPASGAGTTSCASRRPTRRCPTPPAPGTTRAGSPSRAPAGSSRPSPS